MVHCDNDYLAHEQMEALGYDECPYCGKELNVNLTPEQIRVKRRLAMDDSFRYDGKNKLEFIRDDDEKEGE